MQKALRYPGKICISIISLPRGGLKMKRTNEKQKTYNSEDSLVVTHPTTNSPACGLYAVNSSVGVARVRNG
ncbi:hypothetical protein ACN42_g10971 [Penicillium freii]|uniref:Uncharacterized protein n=1 Tax=Penicillium freii TaxID=48697 RepID=A0A101M950_PENFR|nr:hypothetical protein ACN42_g10971 [Penicillium freii]